MKNYLLCKDIELIVFPYGFHGERKGIFDEVIQRLRNEEIEFELRIFILKCAIDENINRAVKDGRDKEHIERGIANTFHFYDTYAYPVIDTTFQTPEQAAEQIKTAVEGQHK